MTMLSDAMVPAPIGEVWCLTVRRCGEAAPEAADRAADLVVDEVLTPGERVVWVRDDVLPAAVVGELAAAAAVLVSWSAAGGEW